MLLGFSRLIVKSWDIEAQFLLIVWPMCVFQVDAWSQGSHQTHFPNAVSLYRSWYHFFAQTPLCRAVHCRRIAIATREQKIFVCICVGFPPLPHPNIISYISKNAFTSCLMGSLDCWSPVCFYLSPNMGKQRTLTLKDETSWFISSSSP